ncbi:MAG: S8 family serine peptidase, partial [Candidatus Eisenbacteria bacterium]
DSQTDARDSRPGATSGALSRGTGEPSHNLVAIHAPEAWARGLTGAGRLIGHFDAGAEGTHSSYADRWRGVREEVPWNEAWFDPYTATEFPYGVDQGHGTGTLGVLLGTQPDGPPLGVAYEAEWIAAGVVIRYDVSKILQAFEWAADPDGDSSTIDDVPDVINHSWGTPGDCTTEYWDAIDLCEAAGIVNVIAVDNSGPSPGSVNSPESRAATPYENFGVGGVDTNTLGFPVRSNSGRGPSPCDDTSIKPELVGPGTAVPGIGPNNAYGIFWSGTSFAAPHVAGTVALLRQLDPSLTVREIKHALMVTAQDLAAPGEDNDTGWGLVDADAAAAWVERNVSPSPPPYDALGASEVAPVALLRWSPPRYLGRGDVPELAGYRVYRAAEGDPFGETPTFELGPFPTELWDRSATGTQSYVVTAFYGDGSESEPTTPVRIEVGSGSPAPPPDERTGVDGADVRPVLTVVPNPFSSETEIRLSTSSEDSRYLEIWSADGRRVCVLHKETNAGAAAMTSRTFRWNGTDHAGRRVPAGVYFGKLSGRATDGPDPVRILRLD